MAQQQHNWKLPKQNIEKTNSLHKNQHHNELSTIHTNITLLHDVLKGQKINKQENFEIYKFNTINLKNAQANTLTAIHIHLL